MRLALVVALLITLVPTVAVSQAVNDTTSDIRQYRSPTKAQLLSIVPGWGYVYTGEYMRGYATWVASIAGPPVGVVMFTFGDIASDRSERVVDQIAGVTTVVCSVVIYVSSLRDAKPSADRANDRHARKVDIAPLLRPPASDGARWEGGFSVHF